jgi:SAM-dependent methyltransferase
VPKVEAGSPERFGYSWERFSILTPEQERQFRGWTGSIDPDSGWRGRRFLDAGCGAGRNSYWPMTYGASGGVAIDLDDRSLAAARANLAAFPSVEVRKASIYEIPYENEFDIAFSIGVVHHLDDPGLALRQLTKAAKPGGTILIWVYGYENLEIYVNVLNPIRKIAFSWMPLTVVRLLAFFPAAMLYAMLRLGIGHIGYLRMLKSFPFSHLHHIVFDQMLPRTANYWRREEAMSLLADAGLVDVKAIHVNDISWTVTGLKPLPAAPRPRSP